MKNFDDLETFYFTGSGKGRKSKPKVRIYKKIISFSKSFFNEISSSIENNGHIYCVRKYSKNNNAIVFNFFGKNVENSCKLKTLSPIAVLSCINFEKQFKLNFEDLKGTYIPEKFNDGWVIYLDKTDEIL